MLRFGLIDNLSSCEDSCELESIHWVLSCIVRHTLTGEVGGSNRLEDIGVFVDDALERDTLAPTEYILIPTRDVANIDTEESTAAGFC